MLPRVLNGWFAFPSFLNCLSPFRANSVNTQTVKVRRDWLIICEITRAAQEYKKNTKGERKRKIVTWNLKRKDFVLSKWNSNGTIVAKERKKEGDLVELRKRGWVGLWPDPSLPLFFLSAIRAAPLTISLRSTNSIYEILRSTKTWSDTFQEQRMLSTPACELNSRKISPQSQIWK